MSTPPQRRWNQDHLFGQQSGKRSVNASASWWITAEREKFTARSIQELPRMQQSIFAKPSATGISTLRAVGEI